MEQDDPALLQLVVEELTVQLVEPYDQGELGLALDLIQEMEHVLVAD